MAAHNEQSNRQGEDFNVFTILGVERSEVTTHSRFLFELLSPTGKHGLGETFLKSFVEIVLDMPYVYGSTVQREDPTEAGRRLDLTIQSSGYLIGIEIKIGAGDQPAQLYDYRVELERRKKEAQAIELFYLTLRGKDPVSGSLQGANGEVLPKSKYKVRSFRENVHEWLDECRVLAEQKPVLHGVIHQYQLIVEKITGLRGGPNVTLANLLLESRRNLDAGLQLASAIPRAKAEVQGLFWNDLQERLKDKGAEFHAEDLGSSFHDGIDLAWSYYRKRNNNKRVGLRYPIGETWVHVNLVKRIHYGLKLPATKSSAEKEELKTRFGRLITYPSGSSPESVGSDWLCCFYNDGADMKIDFYDFNEAARALLDSQVRAAAIEMIVGHLTSLEESYSMCTTEPTEVELP